MSWAAASGPGAGVDTPAPGPVLAVLAHPDDETLQLGGVLALAAAAGRHVVVVTATRGERGEMIGAPELEGTDAVADVRARELADALAALGVAEHRWLEDETRWTDSGMAWVAPGQAGPAPDAPGSALVRGDADAQARALARLLRELRPAVVLCDEPGGSYGHPDHVHVHALVLDAVERAAHAAPGDGPDGEPWDVPVLAWAVQDADRLRAARAALADVALHSGPVGVDGAALTVPTEELPALARPSAEVDVELDVTPVVPALLAALRRYPSQVQGASVPVLDAAGAGRQERATRALRPDQAAVGWYALSNGVLAPILPVAGLQLGRGDVAALGVGLGLGVNLPARPGGSSTAADAAAPVQPAAPSLLPARPGVLAARAAAGLAFGLLIGVVGTVVHRVRPWDVPLGLVLAVACVAAAGLLARAAGKGGCLLGYGVGIVVSVQVLTFAGDGDVLVPSDALGMAWLLLSVLAVGAAAFLPRRWVGERR